MLAMLVIVLPGSIILFVVMIYILSLTLIKIHDKLPSSDHLPLSACIDIPLVPHCSCSRKSLKMTFNWAKATDVDLCSNALHTFQYFKSIPINCAIKCDDVICSSPEHRQMIDLFYSQICCELEQSSQKTIASNNFRYGLDSIVPGFNDFVK